MSATSTAAQMKQVAEAARRKDAEAEEAQCKAAVEAETAKVKASQAKQAARKAKAKTPDLATILKRANLSEKSELTNDQRDRALSAPASMSATVLRNHIMKGGDITTPTATETNGKPAAGEPPRGPVEQDSVPMFEDEAKKLNGPGYIAYVVLANGDLRKIGACKGQTRTIMAAEARKSLAKMDGYDKAKAADAQIVSVRPNGMRLTPSLTAAAAATS